MIQMWVWWLIWLNFHSITALPSIRTRKIAISEQGHNLVALKDDAVMLEGLAARKRRNADESAMNSGSLELPAPSLSVWLRLYIYGIHGFMTEVLFTAAWDLVVTRNPQLPGCTSVWSFLIYSTNVLGIESFYRKTHNTVPLIFRGILYVVWTYIWEFSTGLLLRQFNACPWDYTERSYNLMGLITLEYAPAWFFASLLAEQVLIKNIMYLKFATPHDLKHNGAAAVPNGHIKAH